jgi:kinesin family member 5
LELKSLLQKATLSNSGYQKYIAALEAELTVWRSGGTVEEAHWAQSNKPTAGSAAPATPKPPTPSVPSSRSMTPVNPLIEGLRDNLESRPQTPTVVALEKDEREEFLRRENELSDSLAEKESALNAAEKLVKELREELSFLKEQEATASKVSAVFLL